MYKSTCKQHGLMQVDCLKVCSRAHLRQYSGALEKREGSWQVEGRIREHLTEAEGSPWQVKEQS